jgi:hypothetical protein
MMINPRNDVILDVTRRNLIYPDRVKVPSELFMDAFWDARAVAELIRIKSVDSKAPTFLFLGRREAAMLKDYLAEVFGEDSVTTLNGTYYMGLNVKTICCDSFFAIGGSKTLRTPSVSDRLV